MLVMSDPTIIPAKIPIIAPPIADVSPLIKAGIAAKKLPPLITMPITPPTIAQRILQRKIIKPFLKANPYETIFFADAIFKSSL